MKAWNWTLKRRITAGFGLLCIALLALGALSVLRFRAAARSARQMERVYTKQGSASAEVLDLSSDLAIASRGFDVSGTEENWLKVTKTLDAARGAINRLVAFSEAHPELGDLHQQTAKVGPMFARYSATVQTFKAARDAFEGSWAQMVPAGGELFKTLTEAVEAVAATSGGTREAEGSTAMLKAFSELFRDAADLRLTCWRAKAGDDAAAAASAHEKAVALQARLRALSATAAPEMKTRLERCTHALQVYENGARVLQQAIEAKLASRAERTEAYFAFIAEVKKTQANATAELDANATSAAALLELSTRQVTLGTLLAVVLGTAAAILITVKTGRLLGGIAGVLSTTSAEAAAASEVVASASHSLAQGSSEQAASLEETSSSLEELAGMTRNNADGTGQASQLTRETREAAERGAREMKEMVGSIEQIRAGSDDIARIIKTIEEIAFQTNLLALNAAVEAARAGEAGLGFAIVADEVRALAHRCTAAARDISTKIEGASERTAHGVEVCARVEASLSEILGKVRKVDELVAQVATASGEQRDGIDQINTAIGQMDRVTQTTAASAEETASAASDLSSQAIRLTDAVNSLLLLVAGAKAEPSAPGAGEDEPARRHASPDTARRSSAGHLAPVSGAPGARRQVRADAARSS